ncbi:MAG: translation initiation factor IF-3 [Clostridiales bacterium]|nr:translation initiation factor IF-3 [Clostridiales bacterium]
MSNVYVVNDQIEEGTIKLITEDGELYGDISVENALEMAFEASLDLVQISEGGNGKLPICKIANYGKMKYKSTKNKKSQKIKVKEIRYGFNIDHHDLKVKHKKVLSFIAKKHSVRYVLELKGRQSKLVDEGVEVINKNLKDFEGVATHSELKVSQNYSKTRISVVLNPV